jgi:hypothetical protein
MCVDGVIPLGECTSCPGGKYAAAASARSCDACPASSFWQDPTACPQLAPWLLENLVAANRELVLGNASKAVALLNETYRMHDHRAFPPIHPDALQLFNSSWRQLHNVQNGQDAFGHQANKVFTQSAAYFQTALDNRYNQMVTLLSTQDSIRAATAEVDMKQLAESAASATLTSEERRLEAWAVAVRTISTTTSNTLESLRVGLHDWITSTTGQMENLQGEINVAVRDALNAMKLKTILLAVGGAILCAVPGMVQFALGQVASVIPGMSGLAAISQQTIINEGRKLLKKAAMAALSTAKAVIENMRSKCANALTGTIQEYCDELDAYDEQLKALVKLQGFMGVFAQVQLMINDCAAGNCAEKQQNALLPNLCILDMDADSLNIMLGALKSAFVAEDKNAGKVEQVLLTFTSNIHHQVAALQGWMQQSMAVQSAQTNTLLQAAQLKIVQGAAGPDAVKAGALALVQQKISAQWFDALSTYTRAQKQLAFMKLEPAECSSAPSPACNTQRYPASVYTTAPTSSAAPQLAELQKVKDGLELKLMEPNPAAVSVISAEVTPENNCVALNEMRQTGRAMFSIPLPAHTSFTNVRYTVSLAPRREFTLRAKPLTIIPPPRFPCCRPERARFPCFTHAV